MATNMEVIGADLLQRNLSYAEREVFPKAMARTLNTTTRSVLTQLVRDVAGRMGVKQKAVRDKTAIWRATQGRLEARIRAEGNALNLIHFKARQVQRGVSAAPWGRRRIFPTAFIATMRGGNRLVMTRVKRGASRVGRLPLRPVRGPGIAKTAAERELAWKRQELTRRLIAERLPRELAFYLSRLPAK